MFIDLRKERKETSHRLPEESRCKKNSFLLRHKTICDVEKLLFWRFWGAKNERKTLFLCLNTFDVVDLLRKSNKDEREEI